MGKLYSTPAQLRARINKVSSSSDDELEALLEAASRNIDRACNRPDGFIAESVATARTYAGSGKPFQYLDEFIEATLVKVKATAADSDYTTWASTDWSSFSGDPRMPDYNSLPFDGIMVLPTGDYTIITSGAWTTRGGFRPLSDVHRGVPTLQVTAKWGFSEEVPADIQEACLMQTARWYKRYQSSMSDALATADFGQLLYRQSLDPDIRRILVDGRYIKPAVGAW